LPQPPRGAQSLSLGGLPAGQAQALLAAEGDDEEELAANVQFLGTRWDLAAADLQGYSNVVASLLSHPSAEVVASAAEALGNLCAPGARFAEAVAATLSHPSHKVKWAAAYALGKFGPEALQHAKKLAAVAEDAQGSDDLSVKTRVFAMQALGQLRAADEAPLAARLLSTDASFEVQSIACLALAEMGEAGRAGEIAGKLARPGTCLAAVSSLGLLGAEVVTEHSEAIVASALCSADVQTRAEALAALAKCAGHSRAPALADRLVPLLSASEPAVRAAAGLALGGLGTAAAGAAEAVAGLLADLAEDERWLPHQVGGGAPREPMAMRKPRCAAVVALGAMHSAAHTKAIAELLEDGDWELRFCALEALAGLGVAAREAVGRVAARTEDDAYPVRAKACFALGALGAEEEADRIVELLQDPAQAVRAEAAAALGALGEGVVREYSSELVRLLQDVSNNVRTATIRALATLGPAGGPYAAVLARQLCDPMPDVRAEVCVALTQLGAHGAAFAEDVAALLEDPAPEVRVSAARALGSLGDEAAPFAAALRQLAAMGTGEERRAVAEALVKLGLDGGLAAAPAAALRDAGDGGFAAAVLELYREPDLVE